MADQFEQIYTSLGGDPSVIANAKQQQQQPPTTTNGSLAGTLALLRTAELVDLHLAARCGELSGLSCLCDEQVRRAYDILTARFSQSDLNTLFRAFCGCSIPTPAPIPTIAAPVLGPPTPTPVAAPAPVVTTTETCPNGLPPKGSYTSLV